MAPSLSRSTRRDTGADHCKELPGQRLARGVCRLLLSLDMMPLVEFVPERGRRVDVMALGRSGEIWVVECKSSRADFVSDNKWQGYLPWCDRFFFATPADFPHDILPEPHGLILADDYGGEILRMGAESRLSAARRRALTVRFARHAASRLASLEGDSGPHGQFPRGVLREG